jgi:hypothetical protein
MEVDSLCSGIANKKPSLHLVLNLKRLAARQKMVLHLPDLLLKLENQYKFKISLIVTFN